MKMNRLFNIFVVAVLVIVVALTIQQSLETSKVVLAGSNAVGSHPLAAVCVSPSEQRFSIHSVFVEPMNSWVTYTESGPTGVDGGLLYLLSNSRSCSK